MDYDVRPTEPNGIKDERTGAVGTERMPRNASY
jgi:hypothetical protein